MWRFYKKRGKTEKKLCKYAKSSQAVHNLFIFIWYYNNSSKEHYERRCNGVYLYHYTYNFFHNNRPGKPLPGHSSFLGLFWALFFVGGDGWREGRTDCRRGGCMVVPGAVVSPGHTKRLSLLPCRAPHNSPCTLMRTWLRQMGLTLRLVAAEYLPVRSLRR